jgi:hypothetical protein
LKRGEISPRQAKTGLVGSPGLRRAAFTSYDPLPTEQLKREKRVEIEPDWTVEKLKKTASTVRSPLGRIGVWFLFSTKRLWGVGACLKDAGRGPQQLPTSPISPSSRVTGKAKLRHGGKLWDGLWR